MQYDSFIEELMKRIEERYQRNGVRMETWERGRMPEDEKMRRCIRKLNWLYYGCCSGEVLQGDFLFVTLNPQAYEHRYRIELANYFNCYWEEGWQGVMREIELQRELQEEIVRGDWE